MAKKTRKATMGTKRTKYEEPLVVQELGCSYYELVWMIQQIPICNGLPAEIVHKVANFFTVQPVRSSEVQVIKASSTSGQHPLSEALNESNTTWWISGTGSMPRGKGREYLEFQFSDRVCRLSQFSIQIPPLPMGPLSVRRLRLECLTSEVETRSSSLSENEDVWKPCSPIWTVENKSGWQHYLLHPSVDVSKVRVVCLTNQMQVTLEQLPDDAQEEEALDGVYSCVGYYCVKFS